MPTSRFFGPEDHNGRVKAMLAEGWALTVLLAPGEREVVVLGFFHGIVQR